MGSHNITEIESVISNLQHREWHAQMVNSIKYIRREITNSLQFIPVQRQRECFPTYFYETNSVLYQNTRCTEKKTTDHYVLEATYDLHWELG